MSSRSGDTRRDDTLLNTAGNVFPAIVSRDGTIDLGITTTGKIATFLNEVRYDELPDDVINVTKKRLLDSIGIDPVLWANP